MTLPLSSTPEQVPNLSRLPSVDRVLAFGEAQALAGEHGRAPVTQAVRKLLDELRAMARDGSLSEAQLDEAALCASLREHVSASARPRLRRVFNLTGTVLH